MPSEGRAPPPSQTLWSLKLSQFIVAVAGLGWLLWALSASSAVQFIVLAGTGLGLCLVASKIWPNVLTITWRALGRNRFWLVALATLLLMLPAILRDQPHVLYMLHLSSVYALMALGLTVTVGWTRQVDLGSAGHFALGAYAAAILNQHFGSPFWVNIALAPTIAVGVALPLGQVFARLQGHYFALATFGFGQIVISIAANWQWLTNGTDGITGIDPPVLFSISDMPISFGPVSAPGESLSYWLSLLFAALGLFVLSRLLRSKYGRAWIAIGDDEGAAACFGIATRRLRIVAYALSAAFASVAGCLYAHTAGYVSPGDVGFDRSLLPLTAVLLGGQGHLLGAALGAVLLVLIPEKLQEFGNLRFLVTGLGLIISLWFRPFGILPFRWRSRNVLDVTPLPGTVYPHHIKTDNVQPDSPALLVRGLTKTFGGMTAVNGVDMDINHGVTVLLGPNGSGKSVFLNLLSGLYRTTAGSICFRQQDRLSEVTNLPAHRRARLGISRSFQTPRLFARLDVLGNILVGSHNSCSYSLLDTILGSNRVKAGERLAETIASQCLGLFGAHLTLHVNNSTSNLSFANLRRLELARALAANPRILLLDEPSAGMNEQETLELGRVLRNLPVQAVLVVEHSLEFAEAVADQVVLFAQGNKVASGSYPTVVTSDGFKTAYLSAALENSPVSHHSDNYRTRAGEKKLLSLEDVTAGYADLRVLRHLNIEVAEGEIVALVGGNGSGKTTTLFTALGLTRLSSGKASLLGSCPQRTQPHEWARRGVAIVPEHYRLFNEMTVIENIVMGVEASIVGADLDHALTVFPELLPLIHTPVGRLSGGQRQMVSLTRAFARSPRLLLMDEPSIGLSPRAVNRLWTELIRLRERGVGILLVEQLVGEALAISDRAYILQRGTVVRHLSTRNEVVSIQEGTLVNYLTGGGQHSINDPDY